MSAVAKDAAAHTAATGEAMDHRSDTLMVVHVPADRRTLYIVSINRDTWVDIPGFGGAKINAEGPEGMDGAFASHAVATVLEPLGETAQRQRRLLGPLRQQLVQLRDTAGDPGSRRRREGVALRRLHARHV